MKHITILHEEGRFYGWPANYGIWHWGDEIVTGFTGGFHDPTRLPAHTIDPQQPVTTLQARSLDGGERWTVQPFPARTPANKAISADEHQDAAGQIGDPFSMENAPQPNQTPIHFRHPDFALLCARTGLHGGAVSWFYVSYDRCHTWQGPYSLPVFGQTGIAARTDYLISGDHECTLFLTAAKTNGREGHVFCCRTQDAGLTFDYLAPVGPQEPEGYSIMPASVRLSESRILTAIRCQGAKTGERKPPAWIELHQSEDKGHHWHYLSTPAPAMGGNPPALLRLHDGRLCLIYGYRHTPYGIRARLSDDDGQHWSKEIVLRDDGGNWDLGYPRAVQRPDGTVVVVYYFNDQRERMIAATLWKP